MDQPEFAKFWAADAKRIEDAVHQHRPRGRDEHREPA